MYEVDVVCGVGDECAVLKSFKNELKKVPFKILGLAENVESLGNLVKLEPVLRSLGEILEI
jgi:hypothetical protein